jgi:hypothetical protein
MSTLADTEKKSIVLRDYLLALWDSQQTKNRFTLYSVGSTFGKWAVEMLDGKEMPKKHFIYLTEKHACVSIGPVVYKDTVTGKQVTKDSLSFVTSASHEYNGPVAETAFIKQFISSAPILPSLKEKSWANYWTMALLIAQHDMEKEHVKAYTEKFLNKDKLEYALTHFRQQSPMQLEQSYMALHNASQPVKANKTAKTGKTQPVDVTELTAIGVALANAETVTA